MRYIREEFFLEKCSSDDQSAQATFNITDKWKDFLNEFEKHYHHRNYRKQLVEHLDDAKQWAALHYAVFNGNEHVFDLLTNKKPQKKSFRCGTFSFVLKINNILCFEILIF